MSRTSNPLVSACWIVVHSGTSSPSGKNVFVDEGRSLSSICCRGGNSAVEEHPSGSEKPKYLFEIVFQRGFSNMLAHADAGNFVVVLRLFDVAIVAEPNRTTVFKTGGVNAFSSQFGLTQTQSDTVGIDPAVRGCVHHQPSPTAPNVE